MAGKPPLPIAPPKLTVRFIAAKTIFKERRVTDKETGLAADMSQFAGMKFMLERLLGHPTYMRLKESSNLREWKRATSKLLDALAFAASVSVEVVDDDWVAAFKEEVASGKTSIKNAVHISDLFASLSVALTRISFLQLGRLPFYNVERKTVPLTKEHWDMRGFRSAQYTQTKSQKEAAVKHAHKLKEIKEKADAKKHDL